MPVPGDCYQGAFRVRLPRALIEAEALSTLTTTMDESPEIDPEVDGVPASAKTFRDFGIAEPICAALEAEGITTAFPIQALTLPVALDGHDLIGQARTGTGKTLAFGIPILERLDRTTREKPRRPVPSSSCRPASWPFRSPTTCRLAGGPDQRQRRNAVRRPGLRAADRRAGHRRHRRRDARPTARPCPPGPPEARQGPHARPRRGRQDARPRLPAGRRAHPAADPAEPADHAVLRHDAGRDRDAGAATPQPAHAHPGRAARRAAHVPSTEQHVFRAHQMDKVEVLARVLQAEGRGLTIVFCRTKRSVDQVADDTHHQGLRRRRGAR